MDSIALVTFVNTQIVPIGLFLVMIGMGLSLVPNDFARVFKAPKAVSVGLVNQLFFLPIIGFILANIMPLEPEYAVGIMLLVVCPGGATSNMFTHLAKGDVALSITMTAVASLIAVFTIPLVLNFSLTYFMGAGTEFQLPIITTLLTLMPIIIVPVVIGMLTKAFAPKIATRLQVHVAKFGICFLIFLMVFLIYVQQDVVIKAFTYIAPVALLLNLSTMALGYFSSRLLNLNKAETTSITFEVGLQNSGLSIFIALTLLVNYKMSFTPAVYTGIMFFTAGVLVKIFSHKFKSTANITDTTATLENK
jgi:BASS family bile acid:Na+ symporter